MRNQILQGSYYGDVVRGCGMRCPQCNSQIELSYSWTRQILVHCSCQPKCKWATELEKMPELENALSKAIRQVLDEFEPAKQSKRTC